MNDCKFPSLQYYRNAKLSLPAFLSNNPDICSNLKSYCRQNLATLSIEIVLEYFNDTIIPNMALERYSINKDDENYKQKRKAVLAKHGLTKLFPVTIYRYMIRLGFKYKARRKG